jgi:hypothetical protein
LDFGVAITHLSLGEEIHNNAGFGLSDSTVLTIAGFSQVAELGSLKRRTEKTRIKSKIENEIYISNSRNTFSLQMNKLSLLLQYLKRSNFLLH